MKKIVLILAIIVILWPSAGQSRWVNRDICKTCDEVRATLKILPLYRSHHGIIVERNIEMLMNAYIAMKDKNQKCCIVTKIKFNYTRTKMIELFKTWLKGISTVPKYKNKEAK